MEDEYKSRLTFPTSLLEIRNDVYEQLQIQSDTSEFFNCSEIVEAKPEGYTHKQILGYIAECAVGFEIINRLGNGELRQYSANINKVIQKGVFKEFIPAENFITIKKVKYFNGILGEDAGHILELSEDNPFISDSIAQNILTKMKGFTYIPYTQKLSEADIAMDCGDKIKNTDTKNKTFESYIMQNSWEFTGALTQNWAAKGENEFNNSFSCSKGPMGQAIDRIQKVEIPNVYEMAVDKATKLITEFNGGYVVKKDGELFIVDNEDLDKAKKVWRWNINGFGYSSKGIKGPYGTAITMDGQIVADFITSGKMLADMIQGGTLKLGGANNLNGLFQLLDGEGNICVQMNNTGIQLADGTGIIGGDGVYTSLSFNGQSDSFTKIVGEGNFQTVGFSSDASGNINKLYSFIDVFIPRNFTLKKAYLNLQHLPFIVQNTAGNIAGYGICSNMKLYKTDVDSQQIYVCPASDTSLAGTTNLNEIGVLGTAGWSPTRPTSANNVKLEQKSVELDIAEFNTEGITRFAVGSAAGKPAIVDQDIFASSITAYKASGAVIATIVLIGYLKDISF